MRSIRRILQVSFCLSGVGVVASGCIDGDAVYDRLREFEDPPAAAAGFLGYTNGTDQLPLCGNCHIGQQAEWSHTKHANAWNALQEGPADPSCEACHTVGARGNVVTDENVAWAATGDARYHDVQCESCHGPGLEHITNPDASQPLPSIKVGVGLTNGCGECHTGNHQPFVEEWSQSGHGDMNPFPQTRAACVQCHEARGVFSAWGIRSEYLERHGTDPLPITCPVCHDPHDATNPHQLRYPIDEPNTDINLCMKCHQRGGVPDAISPLPHSPQGPLLLGTAGWRPPNFSFADDTIVATHGTTANPRLCAGCHVNRLEVTDLETGQFVFQSTGHLFRPIPCLDADGIPTPAQDCDVSDRSFAACSISGCHGSQSLARSAFVLARGRLDGLVAALDSLLAQVPASEFDFNDEVLTTAEGARFNSSMASLTGSAVHNPFLMEALLNASIQEVKSEYGVTAPPAGAPIANQGER